MEAPTHQRLCRPCFRVEDDSELRCSSHLRMHSFPSEANLGRQVKIRLNTGVRGNTSPAQSCCTRSAWHESMCLYLLTQRSRRPYAMAVADSPLMGKVQSVRSRAEWLMHTWGVQGWVGGVYKKATSSLHSHPFPEIHRHSPHTLPSAWGGYSSQRVECLAVWAAGERVMCALGHLTSANWNSAAKEKHTSNLCSHPIDCNI